MEFDIFKPWASAWGFLSAIGRVDLMAKMKQDSDHRFQAEIESLRNKMKDLEIKLDKINEAFSNIIDNSSDGIVIVYHKKRVVYANVAMMHLFGRTVADLLGNPLNIDINIDEWVQQEKTAIEITAPKPDGTFLVSNVFIFNMEWNNEPAFLIEFHNITEQKKNEKKLEYISRHDYLTGLRNRFYFEKEIKEAIQRSESENKYMALLYLDLDNFKVINNTLGHDVGDLLLKEVSKLLQDNIRQSDHIARLGGDEFVLVLSSLRKPEYAGTIASNVLDKLADVFFLNGVEIYTNGSIGIAIYPWDGKTPEELIKSADMAMYAAKERGKNQYRYYSDEINLENEEQLYILNGLRKVISNEELFLLFQPIIDVQTRCCWGIEALLRWQHPQLGILYPEHFFSIADKAGMMLPIEKWVIENAFFYFGEFSAIANLHFSINISSYNHHDENMAEIIENFIHQFSIDSKNIILELTETRIMLSPELFVTRFKELLTAGISVAIDDYGTGYSSLSYLKYLPITFIKIDKSFIRDIVHDQNDRIIVESVIRLAHGIGLKVIAEGVETEEQLRVLKSLQCDYCQGFYFSIPLHPVELKAYLQQK